MGLLDGKVAIITGASRGIGKAIALKYAAEGAKVAFTYLSSDEKAKALEDELKANGVEAKGFKSNAANFEAAEKLVKEVIEEFGTVDVVVNNAGITRDTLLMRMTEEQFDEVINTNLKSVFNLTKCVLRTMLKARKGSIVNVGSNSGIIVDKPQPQASYNASKAAVHQLTKSLACEWAKYNIRVNAIAPGYVATKMTLLGRNKPNWFKYWIEMTPMKRLAKPSEIASSVLFLASDSSSYCTGSILSVDGGYTSW